MPEQEQMIVDAVKEVLQMRSGVTVQKEADEQFGRRRFSRGLRQTSQEEIFLACLRKLHKSAKRWSKNYGERGYLGFISNFV